MSTMSSSLIAEIKQRLSRSRATISISIRAISSRRSRLRTELGDLAFPIAFDLAKRIKAATGEKNPRDLATKLAEGLTAMPASLGRGRRRGLPGACISRAKSCATYK